MLTLAARRYSPYRLLKVFTDAMYFPDYLIIRSVHFLKARRSVVTSERPIIP